MTDICLRCIYKHCKRFRPNRAELTRWGKYAIILAYGVTSLYFPRATKSDLFLLQFKKFQEYLLLFHKTSLDFSKLQITACSFWSKTYRPDILNRCIEMVGSTSDLNSTLLSDYYFPRGIDGQLLPARSRDLAIMAVFLYRS